MNSLSNTLRIVGGLMLLGFVLGLFHQSTEASVLGRFSVAYAVLLTFLLGSGGLLLAASRPAMAARIHAVRFQIVILTIMSMSSLIMLEGLVRLTDPIGISYYELGRQYTSDKLADERLAYRHRPNHSGNYAGWLVETNSMGFRDREIPQQPAEGEVRVLLLGDSVTLGMGVAHEDIFAQLLELELSRRIGLPVEVINTGVGSYNTEQELMVLEDVGLSLSPDAIILTFLNNDVHPIPYGFDPDDILKSKDRNLLGKIQVFAGHSWLYRLAMHVQRISIQPMFSEPPAWWATGIVPGWDRVQTALEAINRHAVERDIPFVVVHWRNTRSPEDAQLQLNLDLVGRAAGFPVVDSLAWFEPYPHHEYLRSPVDSHPNAFGHRLTADGIMAALEDHGVIAELKLAATPPAKGDPH